MGCMTFGLLAMAGVESRPKRRHVDFASVPPSQWKMHDRLELWARWCRGGSGESARIGDAAPMFSLYRSTDAKRQYGEETSVPVEKDDALRIHFAIVHPTFDPQCRRALQWSYLKPRDPTGKAREMNVTMQTLADLVRAGRAMLIDRGV